MGPLGSGRKWLAFGLLTLLAVDLSEFMTGGILATPQSLLLFLLIPIVPVFYGLGVLLVREVTIRWQQGWVTVLLLGGAYGLVQEGLLTKVFFASSSSSAVGYLGIYGRYLGVNWVLVAIALIFHGVFTVTFSLFFLGSLLPETRGRALLSSRQLGAVMSAFGAITAIGYIFVSDDPAFKGPGWFVSSPPAQDVLLVVGMVTALALVAWRVPAEWSRFSTSQPIVSPLVVGVIGLVFSGALLLLGGLAPHLIPWPVILILAIFAESLGCMFLLRARMGNEKHLRHEILFVAGALVPYLFIGVALEVQGDVGVLLFTALPWIFLAEIWRRSTRKILTPVGPLDG